VVLDCPLVSVCRICVEIWAHLGDHAAELNQFLNEFLGWRLWLWQFGRKLDVFWIYVVFRERSVVGPIAPV